MVVSLAAMHPITRSIIQGSGIGPTLWIVMASDLRSISEMNLLFKYADDTNLLVPENTDVELADEFCHVRDSGNELTETGWLSTSIRPKKLSCIDPIPVVCPCPNH